MTTKPVILWFRQDLRLHDNPALTRAAETGAPLLPVYVLDQGSRVRPMGAASLWWLDKSLRALDVALKDRGARLILRRGDSESELRRLIAETGADCVYVASSAIGTQDMRSVTKLGGEVKFVAVGSLPNDGKVIADERPVG